ncbi:MAG TPA: acetate--CoA ligase [Nocardioides sp.]|uniref:acetate--CoA ligase n=1 Tax=Nocardioides sp. TaxID=35761 RepID=UPI002B7DE9F5|nr:acetate--CoA ligase [Nocardioides sp.]HTW13873.1 acetate--CoA ligase [Nocardioides sp.]
MADLRPPDDGAVRAAAAWTRARAELDGLPGGGLNIASVAVDRHVVAGRGHAVAIRRVGEDGAVTEMTYDDLRRASNRFAGALAALGVARGERVMTLLGRCPELYVTALGTWKRAAVLSPLFSSFGPEPVRDRLRLGSARVLVTTPALYQRRVAPIRDQLPALRHVLLVGHDAGDVTAPATSAWDVAVAAASPEHPPEPTGPDDMALLHFTSGTTGRPKGAVHVHEAVVAHHATAAYALDLRAGDVFWCTADPGWVTGTSYGIIAPLTRGATLVSYAGEFDPRGWYRVLEQQRVQVWYTAPTALRMLMRAGADLAKAHDLSALRHIASVGEALNPEVVDWGRRAYGMPVHDNWWQTETGAIMICNRPGGEVRAGSMGRPVPGVVATVLERGPSGRARIDAGEATLARPGEVGELALRPGWPSMFRAYLDDPDRYDACFGGGWYLSGDLARIDDEGYYWFVGRADDVIKSAGHLVGPFEVESALLEHPAVAEAGVIGVPDPVAGEIVQAFVTLNEGFEPSQDLRVELLAFARRRLGGLAPRDLGFDQHLPHTSSGKVMRRLLRARTLGLPEGDTSTLEVSS